MYEGNGIHKFDPTKPSEPGERNKSLAKRVRKGVILDQNTGITYKEQSIPQQIQQLKKQELSAITFSQKYLKNYEAQVRQQMMRSIESATYHMDPSDGRSQEIRARPATQQADRANIEQFGLSQFRESQKFLQTIRPSTHHQSQQLYKIDHTLPSHPQRQPIIKSLTSMGAVSHRISSHDTHTIPIERQQVFRTMRLTKSRQSTRTAMSSFKRQDTHARPVTVQSCRPKGVKITPVVHYPDRVKLPPKPNTSQESRVIKHKSQIYAKQVPSDNDDSRFDLSKDFFQKFAPTQYKHSMQKNFHKIRKENKEIVKGKVRDKELKLLKDVRQVKGIGDLFVEDQEEEERQAKVGDKLKEAFLNFEEIKLAKRARSNEPIGEGEESEQSASVMSPSLQLEPKCGEVYAYEESTTSQPYVEVHQPHEPEPDASPAATTLYASRQPQETSVEPEIVDGGDTSLKGKPLVQTLDKDLAPFRGYDTASPQGRYEHTYEEAITIFQEPTQDYKTSSGAKIPPPDKIHDPQGEPQPQHPLTQSTHQQRPKTSQDQRHTKHKHHNHTRLKKFNSFEEPKTLQRPKSRLELNIDVITQTSKGQEQDVSDHELKSHESQLGGGGNEDHQSEVVFKNPRINMSQNGKQQWNVVQQKTLVTPKNKMHEALQKRSKISKTKSTIGVNEGAKTKLGKGLERPRTQGGATMDLKFKTGGQKCMTSQSSLRNLRALGTLHKRPYKPPKPRKRDLYVVRISSNRPKKTQYTRQEFKPLSKFGQSAKILPKSLSTTSLIKLHEKDKGPLRVKERQMKEALNQNKMKEIYHSPEVIVREEFGNEVKQTKLQFEKITTKAKAEPKATVADKEPEPVSAQLLKNNEYIQDKDGVWRVGGQEGVTVNSRLARQESPMTKVKRIVATSLGARYLRC